MNLYFLQYNNYYNRIVKKYDDINKYTANHRYLARAGVNFNTGDGITTDVTVNWNNNWMPDYVVANYGTTKDLTRWFVINYVRLRGQQYKLFLRRDLIADNLENILESDCFIEKAIVPDENPLIFNKESSTVNQIKTNEWELRDATGCAWICGYYSKEDEIEGDNRFSVTYGDENIAYDYEINGKTFEEWKNEVASLYFNDVKISIPMEYWNTNANTYENRVYTIQRDYNGSLLLGNQAIFQSNTAAVEYISNKFNYNFSLSNIPQKNLKTSSFPSVDTIKYIYEQEGIGLINALTRVNNISLNLNILKYNNKIVKFVSSRGDIQYIKLQINLSNNIIQVNGSANSSSGALWDAFYTASRIQDIVYGNTTTSVAGQNWQRKSIFYYQINTQEISISGEYVPLSGEYQINIQKNNQLTQDSVFGMFCLPYPVTRTVDGSIVGGTVDVIYDNTTITIKSEVSLNAAINLAKKYAGNSGGGIIKDIQILPYCPIQSIVNEEGKIEIPSNNNNIVSFIIHDYDDELRAEIVGIVLHPQYTSFTIDAIPFDKFKLENVKISNETDMIRLISPNYSGQFEFTPAKNNGISYFNVDCTYQPYNPYIHVNPNFSALYGSDFNDARGLVCSGDFSLPLVIDQWSVYQMNNKNYNTIFNREIENMEIQHDVSRFKDVYNIATSGIKGAVAGAAVSGGNPIVAGVNAVGNMAEAGMNMALNERLRDEALDYKKDMFGFQLGNIKAMPQSISKVSPFSYNNKYFPIVEYYTCTPTEKEAIANKIAYNGMTVMTIGKLKDYVNNLWSYKNITSKRYIKGQLIRLENFDGDYHILNEIGNELNKGVYYEGN